MSDLSVSPLIPAKATPAVVHQPGGVSGREQGIVVMFIDMRGSTRLSVKGGSPMTWCSS